MQGSLWLIGNDEQKRDDFIYFSTPNLETQEKRIYKLPEEIKSLMDNNLRMTREKSTSKYKYKCSFWGL